MDAQSSRQMYFGPIKLAAGVKPGEIGVFLVVIALAQAIVSFCALMQPFIFTDILHIPGKEQGQVGGMLASAQQAMLLVFINFAGALADRWGRKFMLIFALVGFAVCSLFFPLVISVGSLLVVRLLFGFSQNGHTAGAPTKMFDYPDNDSRGKFMALIMVSLNLSTLVLVGLVGSRLPSWLRAAGLSSADAGRWAFWIVAATAAGAALLCTFGMQRDRRVGPAKAAGATSGGAKALLAGFREVYRHALRNPSFALIFITGFVIRTDQTVLQSFVSLWVVTAGHTEHLSTLQGLKIAGLITSVQSVAFLLVPLVTGPLLDRFNRTTLYAAAMGFSGVTLISTILVHDVQTWPIYVVMAFVAVAEAAQIITQQALFGQEAPELLRGTAYGVFAFTGTITVVVITAISGVLFDKVGYTSPFVLAGVLHLAFLAIGLAFMAVRRRTVAADALT